MTFDVACRLAPPILEYPDIDDAAAPAHVTANRRRIRSNWPAIGPNRDALSANDDSVGFNRGTIGHYQHLVSTKGGHIGAYRGIFD